MDKIGIWIERILKLITLIFGILTIVEVFKTYLHKKELKEKADSYLEEELELEGNIKGPVTVYSSKIKEQNKKVMNLFALTGIGCIGVLVIHLVNRERY